MADNQPPDPAQLAAARTELASWTAKARAKFQKQAQAERERIAYAKERGAYWQGLVDQLAPHLAHPEAAYQSASASLMVDMYAAQRRMLEIELAACDANAQYLSGEPPVGQLQLRNAAEELGFHESRLRATAALAPFLWRARIDGIDAVLRSRGLPVGRPGSDAADEAQRVARGQAITPGTTGDASLDQSLDSLAADLQAMRGVLDFAGQAFTGFARLAPEAQRALLKDPRWASVEQAVSELQKLHTRVSGMPSASKLFPRPVEVELPYAPLTNGPASTGRLASGPDQADLNRGRTSTFRLGDDMGKPKR